jgi:tryptophan synthase alpha chain
MSAAAHSTTTRPRDRVRDAVLAAKARGTPALVAFMTAGHPSRASFRANLTAIGNEADLVEIGVPFTDPMADGMTIQRSSHVALQQGVTLRWILEELTAMARPKAPLLLMSYLNPLLAYGFDKLPTAAVNAGVCGFIVPDMPFDEGDEFRAALEREGLALVNMVTPVTTPERLRRIAAASHGFLYAVTMTGTTGKSATIPSDVTNYLQQVRAASPIPVCAGFGIRSREQVERLRGSVEGVIVGSALVEVLEQGGDPAAFLRSLRPVT